MKKCGHVFFRKAFSFYINKIKLLRVVINNGLTKHARTLKLLIKSKSCGTCIFQQKTMEKDMKNDDLIIYSSPTIYCFVDLMDGEVGYTFEEEAEKMARGRAVYPVLLMDFKGHHRSLEWRGK